MLFTEHPRSVNETYIEHLCCAWSYSFKFLMLFVVCMIHGLFPFLFTTTSSDKITEYNDRLQQRRNNGADGTN